MSLAVSERDLQTAVTQMAALFGWLRYHTHDSRRSAPGFPDLVLVRDQRVVFAELKSPTGRVRPEQQVWLDALGACPGVEVYLWRPADLDAIEAVLR